MLYTELQLLHLIPINVAIHNVLLSIVTFSCWSYSQKTFSKQTNVENEYFIFTFLFLYLSMLLSCHVHLTKKENNK